ncbi:expressed unknown protein (Partial), partial [Seminavis robusta]
LCRCWHDAPRQQHFLLLVQGVVESDDDKEESHSKGENFAVATFTQCVVTFEKWLRSDTLSWAMLQVPDAEEHETTGNDEEVPSKNDETRSIASKGSVLSNEHSARTKGVPAVVTITLESTPHNRGAHVNPNALLPLKTKEMWSWACSGSLQALECTWTPVLSSTGPEFDFPLITPCIERSLHRRVLEQTSATKALGRVFMERSSSKSIGESGSEGGKTRQHILVEAFPSCAKSRLISLASRIITATDASIKQLDYFFRLPTRDTSLLSFVEALITVLAWVTTYGQKEDLVVGIRKWYIEEGDKRDSEEDKLSKGFSRLMFKIEKLEAGLRKLHDLLLSLNKSASAGSTKRMKMVDKLIDSLFGQGPQGPEQGMSIAALVERKVQLLIENQVESRKKRGTVAQPGSSNTRKRRKTRHEKPIRSRNQTVDKWLQSDKNLEDDAYEDEAFLDLEDFIADG